MTTQATAPATTETTPEQRSTEFVPVKGGADTTSAEALLVTAYLVMWAVLFGFIFLGWRRQLRLEGRLSELDARLRRLSPRD